MLSPTPPAMTIASGGQKSPPLKTNSGVKPAMVVTVEDHGRGLRPEALARVFDGLESPSAMWSIRSGGTGLELPIARLLARAMDGDLTVDAGTDSVLRRHGAIDDGISLKIANGATYFSYSSTGLGRPNIGGNTAISQVVMCDERGNVTAAGGSSAARLFVVTPLGRATIIRDEALIANALATMGKSCP